MSCNDQGVQSRCLVSMVFDMQDPETVTTTLGKLHDRVIKISHYMIL